MKTLARRTPLDIFNVFENLDPMFELWSPAVPNLWNRDAVRLPLDVFEKDNELMVRAYLPGIKPKDLDVTIDHNMLTITGEVRDEYENDEKANFYMRELRYGKFVRTVRLPETVDVDKITSEFDNGYLTLRAPLYKLPKIEPKKIEVKPK